MTGGESIRVMHPLFQEGEGGSTPTSPLSAKELRVDTIPFDQAKELNRAWHSRLPLFGSPPDVSYLSFGAERAGIIYAVAIWSRPVNRSLPKDEWLELRRLAVSPEAPKNTASRTLAVMTTLIRRMRPNVTRLVSYQDMDVHTGGIYKAAGWSRTTTCHFAPWDNGTRNRRQAQSDASKARWELVLTRP
jgi:hypothetical protein